ncbi:DUF3068 domain-containing protein [Thermobifida fusca]|jgi:hypothetical protein|uniref:DUF3068 domain-containing protein n=1 Tax=Thermobifida fusca (strain YX) TaxID=269800 RepID=Q47M30_THEFY|nr:MULTISPECIES: DUF3068 domain-containing protein [Thermobifida]AAZ56492.1 conserved hypothetical protein [Thermobifida fusca YX]MBO2530450.1 DUF3068 domain-containing protein [Thermobifida sp.]PPS93872.1 hypothetical protein BH05_07100 [Thermobifida fusca]PZN61211.1 MAG: DUF3068 domain-containing protein [Thermobifida fusca]QOS58962.1 DUF3068 domain-containing protein [Thermobifida fusca]
MRRTVATVGVAFGVFCLVLAPLLRYWVASAFMKTPLDYYAQTVNRSEDATYFNVEEMKVIEGATVEAHTTLKADVRASDDDIVVWDEFRWVKDVDRDFAFLSTTRHTAHDRVTGEAVDCCGSSVNEESVPQSGQAFKWPFLVEQRDYEFFDSTVREALPIRFEGVEEVDGHPGVEAYKFVQEVEPTVVETRELPRSLLGLDGEGDVTADIVYSNTRTYWVDPITGSPLDLREEQRRVAVVDGEERLVMFDATMDFTDETVAERVAAAADGDKIILIRTTLPIVLLAVGAVVLVIGLALSLSRTRTPAHARA